MSIGYAIIIVTYLIMVKILSKYYPSVAGIS